MTKAPPLLAVALTFCSACSSDDDPGPQAPPTGGGDSRDAAVPFLPGEGVDETPASDRTTRRPPTTRSDEILRALAELRRQSGLLPRRDGGFAPPLGGGGDPVDAGTDAGISSVVTDGGGAEDASEGESNGDVGPGETEPLDAGSDIVEVPTLGDAGDAGDAGGAGDAGDAGDAS